MWVKFGLGEFIEIWIGKVNLSLSLSWTVQKTWLEFLTKKTKIIWSPTTTPRSMNLTRQSEQYHVM